MLSYPNLLLQASQRYCRPCTLHLQKCLSSSVAAPLVNDASLPLHKQPLVTPQPPRHIPARQTPKTDVLLKRKEKLLEQPRLARFINVVMWDGEKERAQKLVMQAFQHLHEKNATDPLPLFNKAIEMVAPTMDLVRVKRAAKVIMVPRPLTQKQAERKAFRWIQEAVQTKKGVSYPAKLADELESAVKGRGAAYGKKVALHKLALSNQANAHLRW